MPELLDLSSGFSLIGIYFWILFSTMLFLIPAGLVLYLFLAKSKGLEETEVEKTALKKVALVFFGIFLFSFYQLYGFWFGFSKVEFSQNNSWYLYNILGYRLAEITELDNPKYYTRQVQWTNGRNSSVMYIETDTKKYKSIGY